MQFFNPWSKSNSWLMAIMFGLPASYIFIKATDFVVTYYNGVLWPGRMIAFGTGVFAFSLLSYGIMGESINMKTAVSLVLASAIVLIQILWK